MKNWTRLLKSCFRPQVCSGINSVRCIGISPPRCWQRSWLILEQLGTRLTPSGPTLSTLASFNPAYLSSGATPYAGVIEDSSGNLFGTTDSGGTYGEGTVFEWVKSSGALSVLASFDGTNGQNPVAGVIEDSNGNLFGTTFSGGTYGEGTVFEWVKSSGTLSVLASFDGTNGQNPRAGVIEDNSGNLFGTTYLGGANGDGTVFEVVPGSGTITTLASFNGADGFLPYAGVIEDNSGNLFGTTYLGGADGAGAVFEVVAGSGTITTLASFSFNGTDGRAPYAGVIEDNSGNLFGTTTQGGAAGLGTVFEVVAGSGTITTLAYFNGTDGQIPFAGVIEDNSGNLFGTTTGGGTNGYGTVFEWVQSTRTLSALANFNDANGAYPVNVGALIEDSSGNLFGTTQAGGVYGYGTVFSVSQALTTTTSLASSANPSVNEQLVTFTAAVTSQVPGSGTPTGAVQFVVDGQNLGSPVTLSATGIATSVGIALTAGDHTVTANYVSSDGGFVNSSGSLDAGQQVNAMTSSNLQSVIAQSLQSGNPIILEADPTQSGSLTAILSAVNGLQSPGAPITLTVDLQGGTYSDQAASPPPDLSLVIQNGTLIGTSPALTVSGGQVEVLNCNLSTATDAPTILLTGGSLSLRSDVVQESTGFADAAIAFVGGSLDLGTAASPGGNTLSVNAPGEFVHNTTGNPVAAVGDTFEINGIPQTANALSFTSLGTSAATTVWGQPVLLTATVQPNTPGSGTPAGSVDFLDVTTGLDLGSVTLSAGTAMLSTTALAVGSHTIRASYSGDGTYLLSLDSLTQTIDQDTTATTVASSVNPSVFGQSVTFTATVCADAPARARPPRGRQLPSWTAPPHWAPALSMASAAATRPPSALLR